MPTKHSQIIEYIKSLEVGTPISVRGIAKAMGVSEGTAYRAIKDAERAEYVKTFPRAGTLRVESAKAAGIEKLTFSEVSAIVEGTVLAGRTGLNRRLSRFVIGAMTLGEMEKYLSPQNLLIIGDRAEAYPVTLEKECAILITGGFGCDERILAMADERGLPIIRCSYDTFTAASLLHNAISQRLIRKDILLVGDIMTADADSLSVDGSAKDWKELAARTGHSRFPIVDSQGNVVGIVASRDVAGSDADVPIRDIMTSPARMVERETTVAYAANIMIWEGIDLLPVTEGNRLIGVLSRQDVIKALQYMRSQPQMGQTLEDMVIAGFVSKQARMGLILEGEMASPLLSQIGTASYGAMTLLLVTAGFLALRRSRSLDVVADSITVYFFHPVQMGDHMRIEAQVIEAGRSASKVEVSASVGAHLAAKALISAKGIRK
jgi:predicted transcriptional regulator